MAFSTPLICCSSGVITVSAMVFGEAPGYWPLTTTVGGTISGYSLIGRFGMASSPATVISMASTVAKIGRSMKNDEIFIVYPSGRGRCAVRTHGHTLRRHGDAGMYALRAVDHDDVAGFQAFPDDAQTVDHAPEFYLAVFDLIVGTEQQYVFLALVGIHGTVFDQDRRIFSTGEELYARKQAGGEPTLLVLQHGARPDGAGLGIQLIVDEIDRPGMGKSLLIGQSDLNGIARSA